MTTDVRREMPKTLSDSKKELLDRLLRGRNLAASASVHEIPRRPEGSDIPMSYGQEQLWIHSQIAIELPIYNDPITIYRYGPMDRSALERALTEIVRRHESWRTTFGWKNGELMQFVQPPPGRVEIPFVDLSAVPEDFRDEAARKLALEDAQVPFNLETGPTFRGRLVCISENEHRLYLALHHIIFDGLSLYKVFVSELQALYEAFSLGLSSPLPDLPLQYADYAVWQRRWVDEIAPRQLAYWRDKLAGAAQHDVLKTDNPRAEMQSYRGAMVKVALDPDTSAALKEIDQGLNVTLFTSLLATFYILLLSQSNEKDLTIATTSAGRHYSDLEGLMGYFLDTLVLRVSLADDPSFADLAMQCKEVLLGALANDGIPFSMLVKELVRRRDMSRHPFFQVMFSLEPPLASLGPAWKFARMDIHNGSTKFDINLELDDTPHGIEGRLVYNRDLFTQRSIERMVGDWYAIVAEVVADPSRRVSEVAAVVKSRKEPGPAREAADPVEAPQESKGFAKAVRQLFSRK
jgi:surfactin family lipopeptide synthetase A